MGIKRAYSYVLLLTSILLCIVIHNSWQFATGNTGGNREIASLTQSLEGELSSNLTNKDIEFWEAALKDASGASKANIYTKLASAYQRVGRTSEAIAAWQEAAKIYERSGERIKLAEVIVDRAQAHNSLGQFTKAIPLLKDAIALSKIDESKKILATAWGVLGNSYSLSNKYDLAIAAYQQSIELSKTLEPNYIVTALNNQVAALLKRASLYQSQASIAKDEGDDEEGRLRVLAKKDLDNAKSAAERALKLSLGSNNLSEVKALLNSLQLSPQNEEYRQQASSVLALIPDSRNKAYSLIKLSAYQSDADKVSSLKQAVSIGAALEDWRAQSFALGELGHFYEQKENSIAAIDLTRSAIFAAQRATATDSLYRWQWQIGRIYKQMGDEAKATDAYRQAIASLQVIRGDIAIASKDLQFDVRDEVEPVYRELLGLLLSREDKTDIREALEVTELLKLTELQNFFGDECLEVRNVLEQPRPTSSDTAFINTIILGDKTYVILQFKGQVIKSFLIPINSFDLKNKVLAFRYSLEKVDSQDYLQLSQEFYQLLIKPIEKELKATKPRELVFINDGILRNIPMAALQDKNHFLVERYAISYALNNSLSVKSSKEDERSALIFGLTVETPLFSELPNVAREARIVQDITKGKKFLDKDFTKKSFRKQVENQNRSIIHIATHGEFKGTASSSFLQAFDGSISLQEFENILQSDIQPINLLTLSACETAAGDERSTLGIAGLATRAGVNNILASLWFVNDAETVPLIEDFYSYTRQPGFSKAEALRKAQLNLISVLGSHPAKWSSLILVNN